MTVAPLDKYRIEYTELLEREKKANEYMDNPNVSEEDKIKWEPEYKKLAMQLEKLLMLIGHYKLDNIRFGWPELLNPGFQNIKKQQENKKEELKTQKLF